MIRAEGISAVVTDIEGTTGSIAFVHKVLFPYARARLPGFIARHGGEVAATLDTVRAAEGDLDDDALVALLRRWIDEDRKAPALKTLQGLIWREGYESGDLVGHVYDDAVRMLRRWREQGLSLYVYSSGSVAAQKLLFGHSAAGDLTPLFGGYFDLAVGPKTSADSYRRIAEALAADAGTILFLSDSAPEISAGDLRGHDGGPAGDPGRARRSVRAWGRSRLRRDRDHPVS
jgi:enolase-phosphatase E1